MHEIILAMKTDIIVATAGNKEAVTLLHILHSVTTKLTQVACLASC